MINSLQLVIHAVRALATRANATVTLTTFRPPQLHKFCKIGAFSLHIAPPQ
jgi:hypothetical protein